MQQMKSKCMDYDWNVLPPTDAEISAGKFVEWKETKEDVHELYVHDGPSVYVVMFAGNCQLEAAFGSMHAVMHEGATKEEAVWERHQKQTFPKKGG